MERRFAINDEDVKRFIFSGKALFTIKNLATRNEETFGVEKKYNMFLVNSRADGCHTYMGKVLDDKSRLVPTTNSKMDKSERPFIVFNWILDNLAKPTWSFPEGIIFYHLNRCGKCGRLLKDEIAVKRGFGPTCYKKVIKERT